MKRIQHIKQLLALLCLLALGAACNKKDDIVTDDTLSVLSQKINGVKVSNGVSGIKTAVSIELIFSHTLKTGSFEPALSFTGPSGAVPFDLAYSNTNSTVTLVNTAPLDNEATYTITVAPGIHAEGGQELRSAFTLSFTTQPFVPANVVLSADVSSMDENGGVATITATLSEKIDKDVTVNLAFGGSAGVSDFSVTTSTLVIATGETTASATLTGTQDGAIEGTEMIEVTIASLVNAVEISPQKVTITLLDDDIDSNGDGFPDKGFIINETLFDPPNGLAGDANGDGTRDPAQDEFIEFINDSDQAVDLSGFTLFDETNLASGTPRHTFPAGIIIPPGGVYVLFGGGSPSGDFGNAQVGVSTSGNMNLSNAEDRIVLKNAQGDVFLDFNSVSDAAGVDFGADQSGTRWPDINGDFVLHTTANPALAYSPGKKADGTNFGGNVDPGKGFIINEVLYDPPGGLAGDANGDGTRSAAEDEFIEFINDSDQPVDLSGFTLFDTDGLTADVPKHTFPPGTIVPARTAYVLFGGGTPTGSFGGAMTGISTSGDMNLNNAGDAITIKDAQGNIFLTFDTATDGSGLDFGADQSITRSPDIDGNFTLHTTANAAAAYSPGTRADGSSFY